MLIMMIMIMIILLIIMIIYMSNLPGAVSNVDASDDEFDPANGRGRQRTLLCCSMLYDIVL